MVKAGGPGLYKGTFLVLPGHNCANEIFISHYRKFSEETEPGLSEHEAEEEV
jgi:hypothetical protein